MATNPTRGLKTKLMKKSHCLLKRLFSESLSEITKAKLYQSTKPIAIQSPVILIKIINNE